MLYTNFTEEEKREIFDLWQISHIPHHKTYDRMIYTSKEANKKFPHISVMSVYKFLDKQPEITGIK